ncbi:MAG: threonine synthase [Clostridiales bacterium]|nr:threonine synthase [Clostridiales bacterium]
MNYISTRGGESGLRSAYAIAKGLAKDKGLYTPDRLPELYKSDFQKMASMDYAGRAAYILGMFLDDFTPEELGEYTKKAYSKEKFRRAGEPKKNAPKLDGTAIKKIGDREYILELFHGPTSAFKDMALQILPYLLTASLRKIGEKRTVCILVATSGDTGKAALEGFRDVEGTKIAVFYPEHGVSDVQKLQMATQKGNNVGVCAVDGNFDDAQTGVKRIFSDEKIAEKLDSEEKFLSSANSINWGRLAPQVVYYISAYLDMVSSGDISFGDKINICVPTGNFGNILAAYIAGEMGLPVGRFICASNANNVLTDFINTGVYDRNRQFYKTLSPSMDILISSNVERLLYYMSGSNNSHDCGFVASAMESLNETGKYTLPENMAKSLRERFFAGCCDDEDTKSTIKDVFENEDYLIDTHTAVAVKVYRDYALETGDKTPTVIASTASAFKFSAGVMEALTGKTYENDLDSIDALSEYTGEAVPGPLSGLKNLSVRFKGSVAKDGMKEVLSSLI